MEINLKRRKAENTVSDPVALPPEVAMQPIESSHHSRAGYDAAQNHLYIDFAKPGAKPNIYRYQNFTPEHYKAYVESDSKGGHFIANIKKQPDVFPFDKVAHVEES